MTERTTIRVLHVDDDLPFLDLAATFLERDDPAFEVVTVEDPETALSRIASGGIDCVVSDHDMPERTGLELLREVRHEHPSLPFLLFTGKGSEEIASEAIRAGVDGYLQKGGPETFELLATQIRNVVTAARMEAARREREKELSLLNRSTLVLFEDEPLNVRLRELAHAIPSGWRDPDHTAARIRVDDEEYATPNFVETEWMRSTVLETAGGVVGRIDVAYVAPWTGDDSPFDDEESEMLGALGNLLAAHLERHDLLERLERSNERLRTLIDNIPAVVYLKSVDGVYQLVNDEFVERVGMSREAVIGSTPADIHTDGFDEVIAEHDGIAIDRGEPVEFEETIIHDGTPHTYLSIRVPLLDADGDPYAVFGISTDITEHAELLAEREQLLNRMTDAFFALDDDWRFTYLNHTAERVLDRTEEDLLGQCIWDEFPAAVDTAFQREYERAMETGETVNFRASYEPLDTLFEVTAYPSDTGLSVYFRDLTAERIREHELEAYRMMVEAVGDPMYVLDEHGNMTIANAAMADFLDRPVEEVVGTHVSAYMPEEDVVRGTELIREVLADDDQQWGAFEMRVSTRDGGYRIVDNKFGLVRDGDDYAGVVGIIHDISERKAHEERLEQENRRLEKFARVVSHDLRNPLGVAEGYTDLIAEEYDGESIERVQAAHERMRTLVEDLLLVAREGRSLDEVEPVDLRTAVQESWETVTTNGASLSVLDDAVVRADRSRLRQLLENLLRNCVEHGVKSDGGNGGSGDVGDGGGGDGDDEGTGVSIAVGALSDGFYVEDDGPGIPDADRDHVFDLGFTTAGNGTGLGLAIVREIADAHGWSIRVTDADGGGARFELTGVEFVAEADAAGDSGASGNVVKSE